MYRWNVSTFAEGYDAAAGLIHPHYEAIQDETVRLLRTHLESNAAPLVIDLGGGSGRLAEKILAAYPASRMIVVDQSEPFLALAERRMQPYGERGSCVQSRLQEKWDAALPSPAAAIVSMSAIHHLEPAEKQELYQRCFNVLAPHGVLLNGDEVRPADDASYLALLEAWARHMERLIAERSIPESMDDILRQWIARNVGRFGEPRSSGDDCHETVPVQLDYLLAAGFSSADSPWHRELWAVLRGERKAEVRRQKWGAPKPNEMGVAIRETW